MSDELRYILSLEILSEGNGDILTLISAFLYERNQCARGIVSRLLNDSQPWNALDDRISSLLLVV